MPKRIANSRRQLRANELAKRAGFANDYQYRKYRRKFSGVNTSDKVRIGGRGLRGEKLADAVKAHRGAFKPGVYTKSPINDIGTKLLDKFDWYVQQTGIYTAFDFFVQYQQMFNKVATDPETSPAIKARLKEIIEQGRTLESNLYDFEDEE